MELQTRHKIKMLDYTQDMLDGIVKKAYGSQPIFSLAPLTKKTYSNLARDAVLGGYMMPWSTSLDMPEDAAYWVTKILWENLDELKEAHSAFRLTDFEILRATPTGFAPFHPGALKYYKEQGLLK